MSAADLDLSSTLRISVTRLARRLRSKRSDESLSLTQLATLSTLDRHGAMTPTALADHERVQPPSMTRVIAGLEQRQLVVREPHPTDGRQVVIALTRDARLLVAEDRRRKEAWLGRQLAGLSSEERDVLRAAAPLLERLSLS